MGNGDPKVSVAIAMLLLKNYFFGAAGAEGRGVVVAGRLGADGGGAATPELAL